MTAGELAHREPRGTGLLSASGKVKEASLLENDSGMRPIFRAQVIDVKLIICRVLDWPANEHNWS